MLFRFFAVSYALCLIFTQARAEDETNPIQHLRTFGSPAQSVAYIDSVLRADPGSVYRSDLLGYLVAAYYDAGQTDSVLTVGGRVLSELEGDKQDETRAILFSTLLKTGKRDDAYEMVEPVVEGPLTQKRVRAVLNVINRATQADSLTDRVRALLDRVEPVVRDSFPQYTARFEFGEEWVMEREGDTERVLEIRRKRAAQKDDQNAWLLLSKSEQHNGLYPEALQSLANHLISFYTSFGLRIDRRDRMRQVRGAREAVNLSIEKIGPSGNAVWEASPVRAVG